MMRHLLGSVPNEHVLLHLGNMICRPGISAVLRYIILMLFCHCTWSYCNFTSILSSSTIPVAMVDVPKTTEDVSTLRVDVPGAMPDVVIARWRRWTSDWMTDQEWETLQPEGPPGPPLWGRLGCQRSPHLFPHHPHIVQLTQQSPLSQGAYPAASDPSTGTDTVATMSSPEIIDVKWKMYSVNRGF